MGNTAAAADAPMRDTKADARRETRTAPRIAARAELAVCRWFSSRGVMRSWAWRAAQGRAGAMTPR